MAKGKSREGPAALHADAAVPSTSAPRDARERGEAEPRTPGRRRQGHRAHSEPPLEVRGADAHAEPLPVPVPGTRHLESVLAPCEIRRRHQHVDRARKRIERKRVRSTHHMGTVDHEEARRSDGETALHEGTGQRREWDRALPPIGPRRSRLPESTRIAIFRRAGADLRRTPPASPCFPCSASRSRYGPGAECDDMATECPYRAHRRNAPWISSHASPSPPAR